MQALWPTEDMSEISKRIDAIIRGNLAPLLKERGFRKKARNFYRQHDDRVELINVQASQWNEGAEGQFTVNVGVYYPAISEITDAPSVKGMPKEYDCTVRQRIGLISEDRKDTWWSLNATSDDGQIAKDVAKKVEMLCLPWLESMSNLDEVKALAAINRPLVAAGISLHQGNDLEARDYLNQSFKKQPVAKSRAMAWGKKHGLIQP